MKNSPAFQIVAGAEAAAAEDAAQAEAVASGTPLTRFQETAGRQYTAIEVVSSIYGWYLRYASGLDGFAILARTTERGGSLDGTLENALISARAFCARNADRRYAFIRTSQLTADERALVGL